MSTPRTHEITRAELTEAREWIAATLKLDADTADEISDVTLGHAFAAGRNATTNGARIA